MYFFSDVQLYVRQHLIFIHCQSNCQSEVMEFLQSHFFLSMQLSESVALLTCDLLLEAWTDEKPNHQPRDNGAAQRDAQCTPPWYSVKAQHCANKSGTQGAA